MGAFDQQNKAMGAEHGALIKTLAQMQTALDRLNSQLDSLREDFNAHVASIKRDIGVLEGQMDVLLRQKGD